MDPSTRPDSIETSSDHVGHLSLIMDEHIGHLSLIIDEELVSDYNHSLSINPGPSSAHQNSFAAVPNQPFPSFQEHIGISIKERSDSPSSSSVYSTLADSRRTSFHAESLSWSQSRSSTPLNDSKRLTETSWSANSTTTTTSTIKADQMQKTLKDKRNARVPHPITIPDNLNFLEKFDEKLEGLNKFEGPGTPHSEKTTLGTPTSLGIPSPPSPLPPSPLPQHQHRQPPVPLAQPGPPAPNWSKLHEYAFIFNVCLAQFITLSALAQTVAPLSIIGDGLGVDSPGQLSWFTAAYSMSLGTFILPAGRLGDMYGHKKIFMLGWLWLALFSFMAGFAFRWGPIAFSIARGFQGIGPALLVPNAMALIGRTFPIGNRRNIVFSIFGACGPTGFLAGAAMSSLFAEKLWWPWSFWTTALVALVVTLISLFTIPHSMAKAAAPPGMSIPTFDILGALTGISGLILINFSLNQAPLVGWRTPYVYFLLIIGVLLASAFVYVELTWAKCPLVPMRGLQSQAIIALACIAAGWASHGIWIYYFFMFLERLRQESPLQATLHLVPVAPIGILWALSTNFLIKKIHVSKVMLLAMIFFLVGMVLLAVAPVDQSYWTLTFLSVVVMPGGMNLSFPAGTILLSNAMPREHQGKAASLVSTVVNYSIASGLGFAGSIERVINTDGYRTLEGYQGAEYLGIGFSGLGVLISLYFVWKSRKE